MLLVFLIPKSNSKQTNLLAVDLVLSFTFTSGTVWMSHTCSDILWTVHLVLGFVFKVPIYTLFVFIEPTFTIFRAIFAAYFAGLTYSPWNSQNDDRIFFSIARKTDVSQSTIFYLLLVFLNKAKKQKQWSINNGIKK